MGVGGRGGAGGGETVRVFRTIGGGGGDGLLLVSRLLSTINHIKSDSRTGATPPPCSAAAPPLPSSPRRPCLAACGCAHFFFFT